MSGRSALTFERLLFALIFILALGLRFADLGGAPLSELEAEQALLSYDLAEGTGNGLGDQPAYVLLAALNFALLGSSNFLARFWPALLGSALVLTPLALREHLGRGAALLLGLGLAIAPEFVFAARLASGLMLGLAFSVLALLAWSRGRAVLAGMLAALALLSGLGVFVGLLVGAIAWLLMRVADRNGSIYAWQSGLRARLASGADPRSAGIAFVVSLLVLATFFFSVPGGLGGLGSGLAAFMLGWVQPSGVPALHLALALLAYSVPVLLLGGVGAVRAWRRGDVQGQALSLWGLAGLLVFFLYPGHEVVHLIWVTLPFWVLAAQTLGSALYLPQENRTAAFGTLLLLGLLLVFVYLDLAGAARLDADAPLYGQRLLLAGGALLLGAIAVTLIAFGWSGEAAALGLVWALGVFTVLMLFAASTRFIGSQPSAGNELLSPGPAPGQADLLLDSLQNLSQAENGTARSMQLAIQSDSAALRWVLRDWPHASQDLVLDAGQAPPAILTDGLDDPPSQAAAYRGQDFVWGQAPDLEAGWPSNLFGWLLFREAPIKQDYLGLWARTDIFPGSEPEVDDASE